DFRNTRQVVLSGNTLIGSNASIASKVQSYGALPTGVTSPTTLITLAQNAWSQGMLFCDLNPAIPGDDALYLLTSLEPFLFSQTSTQSQLRKYTFDGSAWNDNGAIFASGAWNLTGTATGSTVQMWLTSDSGLYNYVDSTGVGGTLTTPLGAPLVSAGTNINF